MDKSRWVISLLILYLFVGCYCRELKSKDVIHSPNYNHTLAKILVQYNAAVYESDLTELFTWTCSRCNGITKGFEIIELIVDIQHCLQAYVGLSRNLNAIVVAFRGTQEHSIQNWVEDLYWKQLDLNYPDMPDAMVHHGFYNAYHNTTLRHGVTNALRRAKKLFGDMDILVIGHSMGGAIAAICALDLTVWLYNADFGSLIYTVDKICDRSGEDPSCSRSVLGSSVADHLIYYGINLQAESWNSCKIVTSPHLAEYKSTDEAGNLILSKNPVSVLELDADTTVGAKAL